MSLKERYYKLINSGYTEKQAWELIYLWKYTQNNERWNFEECIKNITPDYDEDHINQLVKCITHDINYRLFLNKGISLKSIIEGRRMQEDLKESGLKLNEKTFKSLLELDYQIVYELRRFLKTQHSVSYFNSLATLALRYNIRHWQLIAYIYDCGVYKKCKELTNLFIDYDQLTYFMDNEIINNWLLDLYQQ